MSNSRFSWNYSHWNKNRLDIKKTLTIPQGATVLFTNDEQRVPLCVIWKQDGSDIYHVRGVTDEFSHEFAGSTMSRAVEYVEQLLEALREDFKNEKL